MKEGIPVGRVGSVPVFLRPSWFLIAALMTVVFAPTVRDRMIIGSGSAYLVAFTFALILLVSVLVHELAHAAAATLAGTPATHIVLDLWGGHTTFTDRAPKPLRAGLISAVGPIANLIVFGVARALDAGEPSGVPQLLLDFTVTANLLLAVFNALPGLPLDGGGVLESLVWAVTRDRHRGTVLAGWFGRLVALAIAGGSVAQLISGRGTVTTTIWLLLAAGLLWRGAGQAIDGADWLRQAGLARAGTLLRPAVAVASTASVSTATTAAGAVGATAVVVLDVYGRPSAIVDEQAAADVPAARAGLVAARTVAHPLPEGAVLPDQLGGEELLERLQASPTPRYAVIDAQERVVGVLDWEDVARFLGR